jgi:hypothetical protein
LTSAYREIAYAAEFIDAFEWWLKEKAEWYLNAGRFRKASNEYARALHADPSYVTDRWKVISRGQDPEYSVDTQTLNLSHGNVVSLWGNHPRETIT